MTYTPEELARIFAPKRKLDVAEVKDKVHEMILWEQNRKTDEAGFYPEYVPVLEVEWRGERSHLFSRDNGVKIELLEGAKTIPRFWDEARRQLAFYIERGVPVPPDFREFGAKLLLDKWPRPTKKDSPKLPYRRNWIICLSVEALVRAGLQATVNEASGEDKRSNTACALVAELMGMKYSTVAGIWSGCQAVIDSGAGWEPLLESLTYAED